MRQSKCGQRENSKRFNHFVLLGLTYAVNYPDESSLQLDAFVLVREVSSH